MPAKTVRRSSPPSESVSSSSLFAFGTRLRAVDDLGHAQIDLREIIDRASRLREARRPGPRPCAPAAACGVRLVSPPAASRLASTIASTFSGSTRSIRCLNLPTSCPTTGVAASSQVVSRRSTEQLRRLRRESRQDRPQVDGDLPEQIERDRTDLEQLVLLRLVLLERPRRPRLDEFVGAIRERHDRAHRLVRIPRLVRRRDLLAGRGARLRRARRRDPAGYRRERLPLHEARGPFDSRGSRPCRPDPRSPSERTRRD